MTQVSFPYQQNSYMPIQPGNVSDEVFEKALRWIGIIFLVAFIFPILDGRKLYIINLYLLGEGGRQFDGLGGSFVIILLLPLIYGLVLLILPQFVKGKPLSITVLCMALLPFIILFSKMGKASNMSFLSSTSTNIFGNLWMFAISLCAMYVGNKNASDSWKGTISKYIGMGGGILFVLYLLIPSEISLNVLSFNQTQSFLLVEIPFKLLDIKLVLTGLVLLAFLVLMVIFAIRLIIVAVNKKPLVLNSIDINNKLFTSAWLLYFIGTFFATLGDIAIMSSKFGNIGGEYYLSAGLLYFKAVLYLLPFLMLLLTAFSKMFADFVPERGYTPSSTNAWNQVGSQQPNYFNPQQTNVFNPFPNQPAYPPYSPLSRGGGGTIYVDTGINTGYVFVNGAKVSSTGSCHVTGLETGEYRIRFQGESSYSQEESIYLTAGSEPLRFQPKIHQYGKLRIISKYKNPAIFIENMGSIRINELQSLPAGNYLLKSTIEFFPTPSIQIEEGKELVVNFDELIKRTNLTIICGDLTSDIQILHEDRGEIETYQSDHQKSVDILPGNIQIKVTSGGNTIVRRIYIKNEKESINFESAINDSINKKKKIIKYAIITGGALVLLIAALIIIPMFGEGSAWSDASMKNTEAAYDEYINKYPEGKYVAEAIAAKESALFGDAKKRDVEEAFVSYLAKYPEGRFKNDALILMEPKMWARVKSINKTYLYDEYIKRYPYGQYLAQAYSKMDSLSRAASVPGAGSNIYLITGDYIRFRSAPNLLPNTVLPQRLMNGQKVEALEVISPNGNNGSGFIKINLNGRIGYVSLDFARREY